MKRHYGWVAGLAILGSASAGATPIAGTGLQDSLTALGGIVNVQTEQAWADERWQMGATGVAASRIQFELGGYADANSFGIYDIYSPGARLTIFAGSDSAGTFGFLFHPTSTNFCAATFASIASPTCSSFTSSHFGFFLDTPTGTYYSQAFLNGDGVDHMVAFEGGPARGTIGGSPWLANEYILAWEDLYGGGDRDYEDFVVMVESVVGVPEPAGVALFGLGLLAIGTVVRRRTAQQRR